MNRTNSVLRLVLLGTALLLAPLASAAPGDAKWHPGHYAYVGGGKLTPEVLALPHFQGVQKAFTWRDLEPARDRYDFSSLKRDLELVRRHGKQLVVQLTFKSFIAGERSVPDYLKGPDFGGGVYHARVGGFNPVLWNKAVNARFLALMTALGREFDRDPNLEAVNLPETAPSLAVTGPGEGVDPYDEQKYFEALKDQIRTLRQAFPTTVVIQYTNFPPKLLDALTDYEKELGVGMGGPDVYPREDAVSDPKRGVYRLYSKLAGTVPLGAAVQSSNYRVSDKKRSRIRQGHRNPDGSPVTILPEDEILIPVRDHLRLSREQLKLNYLFWATTPVDGFAEVKKMLASPDLANDPAGGLITTLPTRAFAR